MGCLTTTPHSPATNRRDPAWARVLGRTSPRRAGLGVPALVVVALGIALAGVETVAAQLCARFTTSLGTFEAELEYEKAPLAVASFVSLAEGTRGWVDFDEGRVRRDPFFEGITFHRVISGFVIQGGSPNGMGTDGPGYTFRDEFVESLRHDGAHVLSMANSGPNSNGSQFFVTLAATPWLDDVHTVFGRVTDGQAVVDAIGAVATGAGNRPVTPVIIEGVEILRKDAAAAAFDPDAHGLADVRTARGVSLTREENGDFSLGFDRRMGSAFRIFTGTGFPLAELVDDPLDLDAPGPPVVDVTASAAGRSRAFFNVVETAYPSPLPIPGDLTGKTITFELGDQELSLSFDGPTTGTWHLSPNDVSGAVTGGFWQPNPYNANFVFDFEGLSVWRVDQGKLGLDSMTAGRYLMRARFTDGGTTDFSGGVTITDTPEP